MSLSPAQNPLLQLIDFYNAEYLQMAEEVIQLQEAFALEDHGDITRSENLRNDYTAALFKLLREAENQILAAVPFSIQFSAGLPVEGSLLQMEYVQSTLDHFEDILETEVVAKSQELIDRYTELAYRRGKTHTNARLAEQGVIAPEEAASIFLTRVDMETMQALADLQFNYVKGMTESIAKDLSGIIRNAALGTWDRDTVQREIAKKISGRDNLADVPASELRGYFNRAKMIAHTEVVRAYNAAAAERISDVTDFYEVIWGGGPCPSNTCPPIVARSQSRPFRFSQPDPRPPFHPRCGCTIVAVFPGVDT